MKRRLKLALGITTLLGGLVSLPTALRHYRAVSLLQAMSAEDRSQAPGLGREVLGLVTPDGHPIQARAYGPHPQQARRIIVLGHGIHHLGISEPRLRRFSEHLANQGCYVLTPLLDDLANYKVTQQGEEILAASVLSSVPEHRKAGLIGFSFAGGMALLAAERPQVAARLDYVASIGGYQDLGRTLRFLASHEVEGPSGKQARKAHEYGMLVLLNNHLDHFDLGDDDARFQQALIAWLKEDRKTARAHANELTTEKGKHFFQLIEKQQLSELEPEILRLLRQDQVALAALSPGGHLGAIATRVLLLHGSGDSVVPPEETLFGAQELAHSDGSHLTLVTPLLEHVRVDHPAGLRQKWELVHFMAQLF